MGDTSLVFSLTTRDQSESGMRSFRENVEQESEAAADDVSEAGSSAGGGFGENLKAGAMGALAGVAMLAAAAFSEAMDQSRLSDKLAAQLDLNEAQSAAAGKVAGDLYAAAYGDSFESVNTAVGSVMSSIKGMTNASSADLKSATANAMDFADAFDIDVTRAAQVAGTAINSGLAKNASEAFDLITHAAQRVPAALRENVLDAVDEYGQFFHTLGYTGEEAFALLVDAAEKSEFGLDKAGDAIKEFTILSTDMSTSSQDAYKAIGLDAQEMANAILSGGDTAKAATDKIIDGLLSIKDPATQANTAIALFGTPIEDLNVSDIPEFLKSLKGASGSMEDFSGAANEMGTTLADNAATRLESFKRTLTQNVVEFIGDKVIPAMDSLKAKAADVFGGLWDEAGEGNEKGVDRVLEFFQLLGQRLVQKAQELAPKTIEALTSVGQKLADYVVANPEKVLKISVIAGAVALAIMSIPAIVAGAIGTAAALVVTGFVHKLIDNTNTKLVEWSQAFQSWITMQAAQAPGRFDRLGDAIGGWFSGLWSRYVSAPVSRTWNSFISSVRALPGRAAAALAGLGGTLAGTSSRAWQRFQDSAVTKAANMLAWTRGLPGRIASSVGPTGALLYSKGQDVVRGLWRGIQSMGGWLRDTLMGWAADIIPGPIADALGIGSPSRVMAEVVGRWLPPGIIEGAEETRPELDRYMADLVNPTAARPRASAAPILAGRGGVPRVDLRIVVDGPEAVKKIIRKIVHDDGGGDVQLTFGY